MFLINLNEIPPEGKSFVCNRNTAELNDVLKDLLGQTAHHTEFKVRPMATTGTFELTGFIRTELPEQCSRCGLDFQLQLNEKFNEILMPRMNTPRDAHFSKANHFSDMAHEGPEVAEYSGQQFDMGEYLHEVVALAEPSNPAPAVDAQENCTGCKISLKNHTFSYGDQVDLKAKPFAGLKGIKIN